MFVHSSRIQKQIEYLESRGVPTPEFLENEKITRKQILDPDQIFQHQVYIHLLDYALLKTGDPTYGLKLGTEPHIAGTIGMLCASCRNLKEAFIQGSRYFSLQGDFATIVFNDDTRYPKITYSLAESWLSHSPETYRLEVEVMFSFLSTILKINSNQILAPYKINFRFNEPSPELDYQKYLGVDPVFGAEGNEMIFRGNDLKIPMKAFNPATFEMLRSYVEQQINRISQSAKITEKVRTILLRSLHYSFPDMDTVASRLNMSPRTLQRHLAAEQTSFKSLLQDTRFSLARQMLKEASLSISEISYMLGYSDLGNFSRSFKNYTGSSPLEYRNSSSGDS